MIVCWSKPKLDALLVQVIKRYVKALLIPTKKKKYNSMLTKTKVKHVINYFVKQMIWFPIKQITWTSWTEDIKPCDYNFIMFTSSPYC